VTPEIPEVLKKRKNSRAKGHRQERVLVKKFTEWWGGEFFRTPGSGAFATRGFVGANISFAGDIVTKDKDFPFCIESKNEEGWELSQLLTAPKNKIQKWWNQALSECPKGSIPLLVFTKNHTPEFFMMPEDAWEAGTATELPVYRIVMQRGTVVIGLLETLFQTAKKDWIMPDAKWPGYDGNKTRMRLGPDPKDEAKEKAKAEKSFDKLFEE